MKKKKLFIEELETRQSSSPLFVAPIVPVDPGLITTMAIGEEGGGPPVTTMAVGEEGSPIMTSFAIGEEGGMLK
ncbi:hypothetical protein BEP19_00945 [Ammoniphilus oxalaticus]|uniref:Uncharacterized protein n=1 Tax=Ammoniphilus oxalaticus TaxID=66863 RepID=A0A419SMS2_9BACL|nr:hypothetical protein [Ammoniphilus oxalaticus]RKD25542.1 hypothetical protein BEP19_00945 [Ammoniphilus oxalaticus]